MTHFLAIAFVLSCALPSAASSRLEVPSQWQPYLFKTVGSCDNVGNLSFQKMGIRFTNSIGVTPDGYRILVGGVLSMFSNETYFFRYMEYYVPNPKDEKPEFKILFTKTFEGPWRIFPGYANQADFSYGDKSIFSATLGSSNLTSFTIMFWPGFERQIPQTMYFLLAPKQTTDAGREESAAQYCTNPY